jgi:xanthine dehydrogenase accessory factor
VTLGAAAGFRVTLIDPIADAEAFPGAATIVADIDFAGLAPGTNPYVVVATQGQWDEEAVATALRRDVAYVGLVASPTRAATVRAYLRDEGVPEERIAALRAPAGLDLGAETAEEVALSILGELVQVRRGRASFVASPGPATMAGEAGATAAPGLSLAAEDDIVLLDPVCGMTVEREFARHLAEHGGVVYAFCSIGCRARFMKDPTAYVPAGSGSTTGTSPA